MAKFVAVLTAMLLSVLLLVGGLVWFYYSTSPRPTVQQLTEPDDD